ncbi:MAG TPA: restriction endonuclease [Firmicutes bacterium]|nr:restriction endonuclease [Candidatus Fermentithermobacillaceae bacterium]
MAVWLVRAGRYGERENTALERGLVAIGWDKLPDLSGVGTKHELGRLMRETYPDEKPRTINNWVTQVWSFRNRMKVGDLVVLPIKTRSVIAIGRVTGSYQYTPHLGEGARHARQVQWLNTDVPRSAFDQDLLYSFGAYLTVCQISRNRAEQRIEALISGRPIAAEQEEGELEIADLEEYARDQIRGLITRKFKGHDLARLVDEVLKAQGYYTYRSPEGPDGGVDIIAGRGPMGFDPPFLCVQVKSTDSPIEVSVLRELQGTMKNYGAERGLLVSWGGFKTSVVKEAPREFFEIRLWDADQLIKAILENYERLPGDLQAEIPLKQIWVLVPDDAE